MGQESEALKADIEQRRQSMTRTIDAYPKTRSCLRVIIERRRTAVTSWAGDIKERVMGSAQSVGDQASSAADKVGEGMSHASRGGR